MLAAVILLPALWRADDNNYSPEKCSLSKFEVVSLLAPTVLLMGYLFVGKDMNAGCPPRADVFCFVFTAAMLIRTHRLPGAAVQRWESRSEQCPGAPVGFEVLESLK